eukprot:1003919-Pleurochrysis_carterae.AAC.1
MEAYGAGGERRGMPSDICTRRRWRTTAISGGSGDSARCGGEEDSVQRRAVRHGAQRRVVRGRTAQGAPAVRDGAWRQ